MKTTVGTWANSATKNTVSKNYRDRDNNVAETPSIDPDIVEALGVYHVHELHFLIQDGFSNRTSLPVRLHSRSWHSRARAADSTNGV